VTPPPGYTALAVGSRRAVVRNDLVPAFGPWLVGLSLEAPPRAVPLGGGRGGTFVLPIDDQARAVVRFGRRGGIVGRLVHARYLGLRPRPFRELRVSLAARARGAPIPEVLAVGVHGWVLYRSAVVTLEVPGAAPALAALGRATNGAERQAVGRVAGTAVARLHAAGVMHPDLNLSNILVDAGGATIVDLDRARLVQPAGGRLRRRWALRRLCRSARKLDPDARLVDDDVVRAFHAAYQGGVQCAS